jgi:flagellar protein FlaI
MAPEQSEPRNRLAQPEDLDLKSFFEVEEGESVVRNDDLEAIVPNEDKNHLIEVDRYWVNKPYAYVVIFQSTKDQEHQYYLVEPTLDEQKEKLVQFLKDKIRQSLDYESIRAQAPRDERAKIIRDKVFELMENYNLLNPELSGEIEDTDPISDMLQSVVDRIYDITDMDEPTIKGDDMGDDIIARLNRRQAESVIYYIIRDYIGYERIDGIMQDVYIEDISQNGWDESTFVVHNEYGQMITNIKFGRENLDQFVTNLAQKAGKGISKRQPDVDAKLEDGSRALLVLDDEISDKGSTFDIRKFTNVPFTPVDLINWGTYTIDMMVYLWLAVEAGKSAIIAGGTASGKTTTLNAISLFIPSTNKIVSIEDTREIQIPQKNWKPTMTREAFGESDKGDIEEYRLLKNSLRMSPEYVIFGEVRGEEARSLFQNMNTGHSTYSTFHGQSAEEARVRLTTEPINVDETTFSGLDLIITQEQVSISGDKQRRCSEITELGEYNPDTEKFATETAFAWNPQNDTHEGDLTTQHMEDIPEVIEDIRHENGWSNGQLEAEINRRRVVLAYLIKHDMNKYTEVASVVQGYMNSDSNVMARIGEGSLENDVGAFQSMRNINISVDPQVEEQIPRPSPPREIQTKAQSILDNNTEVYEDIDVDMDLDEITLKGDNRLQGDTYESQTRRVRSEKDLGETDDDTPYGYDDDEDIPAQQDNTDSTETSDGDDHESSDVFDDISDGFESGDDSGGVWESKEGVDEDEGADEDGSESDGDSE